MYKTESITIFIGLNKKNKITILPYVFNNKKDKIKVLNDGNIINIKELNSSFINEIEKLYNTKLLNNFNLNTLLKTKDITHKDLEDLTNTISKFYKIETTPKHQKEELLTLKSNKSYNTLDVFWLIGIKNNINNEVIAIPFIFNDNNSKIKILTDEKIFNINKDNLVLNLTNVLEEKYNVKLYTFYTLENITKSETITIKEIENYKYAFEIYFKNKIIAENYPELNFLKNDNYKNF